MPLLGHGPSYIKSSRLLAGFSIHRTLTTPAHLLVKSVLLSSTVPCSPYNALQRHTLAHTAWCACCKASCGHDVQCGHCTFRASLQCLTLSPHVSSGRRHVRCSLHRWRACYPHSPPLQCTPAWSLYSSTQRGVGKTRSASRCRNYHGALQRQSCGEATTQPIDHGLRYHDAKYGAPCTGEVHVGPCYTRLLHCRHTCLGTCAT